MKLPTSYDCDTDGSGSGSTTVMPKCCFVQALDRFPVSAADFFVLQLYVQTCDSFWNLRVHLYIFICAAERAHDNALELGFVNLNLLPKAVYEETSEVQSYFSKVCIHQR